MGDQWIDEIASVVEVKRDEPMSAHTSFRLGGPVQAMAFLKSRCEVSWLLDKCEQLNVQFRFLGNGTNVLVADEGVRGLAINLKALRNLSVCAREGNETKIFAESGVLLEELVDWSVKEGISGLEFAAGIPGSVGGAIAMNAGTSSGEMKDVVKNVLLCDPRGRLVWSRYSYFSPSYRTGGIPKNWAILGGEFVLSEADAAGVKAKVERYIERRKERQPYGASCAGSVFKNPTGDYAARMIENLGLKGHSIGGAKISEIHANFIVNEGACAKDVLRLIRFVKSRVKEKFDVKLELEIELWGFNDVSE